MIIAVIVLLVFIRMSSQLKATTDEEKKNKSGKDMIADNTISEEKMSDELYESLPDSKKNPTKKRDDEQRN